jgi:cytochrome c oxidase cbb3-type subunit 3
MATTFENKVLDHDVDGIKEYDNPMPGWLWAILWGTVVFTILYIGFYALAFAPASMKAEYRVDQVELRKTVQAYYATHPIVPPSSDVLLQGAADPKVLDVGKARFVKTCAPCHGENAQGLIGPNLTDNRWLYGGQVVQIFNTVAKGVPAKGMPTWGRVLPPVELAAVVSYVRSVQGTSPANAKQPEGDAVAPEPLPQVK